MKTNLFAVLIILYSIHLNAQCNIDTGIVTIPDAVFKSRLLNNSAINTNGDDEISCEEATAFSGIIDVSTSSTSSFSRITSLIGIEAFTAITGLDINNNDVVSLDVSKNTSLQELYCYDNNLTNSLDLSENSALTIINCSNNNLLNLNLQNGNYRALNIAVSDFKNNPNLTCISVDNLKNAEIKWTSLKDATASYNNTCVIKCYVYIPNTALKNKLIADTEINTDADDEISCKEASSFLGRIEIIDTAITDLTGLDAFVNLTSITIYNNVISSFNFSSFTKLRELYLFNFISLDLSNNTALELINISNCSFDILDLSNNTELQSLTVNNNPYLVFMNLTNSLQLTSIECTSNEKLKNIDFSNNIALETINVANNDLRSLNLTNNTALTTLDFNNNQISTLDISNNLSLNFLKCSRNQITALDVSNHTELNTLWCAANEIATLDVINNIALTSLDCSSNQIAVLDVANSTTLETLVCENNQLVALDLSNNTELTLIDCSDNQLTSLNLKNGNNLNMVYNTSRFSTDFSNNPNLECIQVDTAAFAYANNWDSDYLASSDIAYFSENCSYPLSTNNLSLNTFKLHPNPLKNNLIIDANEDFFMVEVLSLDGKLLLKSNEKKLDVTKLSKGIYLVKITAKSKVNVINKVIKL